MSRLDPKHVLLLLLAVTFLIVALAGGSAFIPTEILTTRRGSPLTFIPRNYRQLWADYRLAAGTGATGLFIIIGGGWLAAEIIARSWQRTRNRELAANAVLLRLAPRIDEKSKWETAADLWAAVHSTLARPGQQVWLGAGLHLSLEIVQQAGERITFYLWAPRPVAETLVRQFRATYSGLEIETLVKSGADGTPTNEIDDYLDLSRDGQPEGNDVNPKSKTCAERSRSIVNPKWAWADLGLARDTWRPLRTTFAADPLPSLLSALEGLSPGNEVAAAHFILRPAEGWQREAQPFLRKLRGDSARPGKNRPKLGSQEREQIRRIEAKSQARGYNLCLRLLVAGQADVGADLTRLIRVFDQFGGDNMLVSRATGTETELYRVLGRFFPVGWGRSVVSDLELAALAHLPNQEITGLAISRARARLEKPSPAAFVGPGEQRVVLGRFVDVPSFDSGLNTLDYPLAGLRRALRLSANDGNGNSSTPPATDRPVGIPLLDSRRHFHVIGPTGVGKSTMLLRMIWQYMEYFPEASVSLQEPHQDLTHKVVRRVPLWREKDVIWLDVMDPERVIGINPLELPPEANIQAVIGDVMGVIKKVMGASWETAVQMQEILNEALKAVLVAQPQPTLVHVFKLLSSANYRYDLTYALNDPISRPYWDSLEMKKERELDQMFSVPRRRINKFLSNDIVRRIVAQPASTLNFRAAIDSGKIILVQLDGRMGDENRTFVGALMMYKLFGAVMSRMDIPEEQRRQVAICADEFQTFVGQSGDEFANILEQARKMGASLTLAHQHLGQLTGGGSDLISSVANNTGTKVVFRAEAADAPQFLKWLPELKSATDLTTLANYRCYVRPLINGSPQPVCTLYTYADPPLLDPEVELRHGRRGAPDPLPAHPGREALADLKQVRQLSAPARKDYLKKLPPAGWQAYLAARHYIDALQRNILIEQPERLPDKLERVRALVRLKYGTPHYETEALVERALEG